MNGGGGWDPEYTNDLKLEIPCLLLAQWATGGSLYLPEGLT